MRLFALLALLVLLAVSTRSASAANAPVKFSSGRSSEPLSLLLVGTGLVGLAGAVRRGMSGTQESR